MHHLRHPVFLLAAGLFLLHQILQYGFGVSIPVADSYLDPFTGTVAGLCLLGAERSYLFGRPRLDGISVVVATVYFMIVSELIFPWLSPRFYFDWLDLLAIGAGALVFALFNNPPESENADR